MAKGDVQITTNRVRASMGYAPDLWPVNPTTERKVIEVVGAINAEKPFLVITIDDEIFHVVYDLLRHVRRALHQWSDADESEYINIISKWGR